MTSLNIAPGTDPHLENEILKRLLDVSLVLNSNFDLETLLKYIMEVASEITHSDSASILLLDPRTNELYFIASNTEHASALNRILVPTTGSIAGEIVQGGVPIIIPDATNDPRIHREVDREIEFVTRSLMGVPMRIHDEIVGVLEVVNRIGPDWTKADQNFLEILASMAAVAINNAEQAESLRRLNEKLKEVDKLKSDFIAIASHELRTPLNIVIGYAGFLQEEAEGEASDHVKKVLDSAQHLADIIENLTSINHLQLGQAELVLETVSLVSVLEAAQKQAEPMAQAKEQYIEVAYPGLSEVVTLDALRIEMALGNILNNAVKFTPHGGKIYLYTEQHGGEVWLRVRDTGIGIELDQIDRVFEYFYQAEDHMTRQHNGLGLGLGIAKGIVEAHGGRIWAESEGKNRGALITISMPLTK